ncbi:MAG: hypothetical protein MJZ15_02685 [Bacteroidales bacterium]|nr:hypothetical protein [Bacteroidales bacterium]
MNNEYDDIINLPHHVSKHHPQMSMYQRAAQFAPFAALTGHDCAIADTARKNAEAYENVDYGSFDEDMPPAFDETSY